MSVSWFSWRTNSIRALCLLGSIVKEHQTAQGPKSEMATLIAYIDGGSHGSPGPSGIGVVIEKPDGKTVQIAKWIGHQDNNVAEYVALLEALQYAAEMKATALNVFTDSELVVKQMTGEYVCRSPRLYSLNWTCRKLARTLKFAIAHVPRHRNQEANRLANHAARFRGQLECSFVQ